MTLHHTPDTSIKILYHGKIYTMDKGMTVVEAIAIKDGVICFAGADKEIKPWLRTASEVIDLQGKTVLPGFHDAHVHPISGGLEMGECDLGGIFSETEILQSLATYAKNHPDKLWIRGSGWALPVFPNANPHKSLLDQVISGRPVYLEAADGHSAWVNSKALELAGIQRQTPDPEKGRIERDDSGEPTGTLREDAMKLVAKYLPEYTHSDYVMALKRAMKLANSFGLVALHEASADEKYLAAYAELANNNGLTTRISAAIKADPDEGLGQLDKLIMLRDKYNCSKLQVNGVKLYADGVLEAKTAALLEPYIGTPGHRGKAIWPADLMNTFVAALDRNGFQVHIHGIGDRGIRMSLDAFEYTRKINGLRDARHHIAHLQLLHPQDIERIKYLDIIANFQPLWAIYDKYISQLTAPVLGPKRTSWLYPIGSVVRSGAKTVFGSDWSVSSMNPLRGIQTATTRRPLTAGPGEAWLPQEVISIIQALSAYTTDGAFLNFQENISGSLEVGKAADLVVLEQDIFNQPLHEIYQNKVLLTMLEAKVVFSELSF